MPTSYSELLPPEMEARVDRLVEADKIFELMKLPYEIRLYTLSTLRYPDLMKFCTASKAAAKVCEDNYFWELKTKRDFGVEETKRESWKKEYEYQFQRASVNLTRAAFLGDFEKVKELLDFGVNPNFQHEGYTALMRASLKGYPEIIHILLEAGADPNLKDWQGQTPLILASFIGYIDIVKKLLNGGADVDAFSASGRTALVFAYLLGHDEIAEELIKAGADEEKARKIMEEIQAENERRLHRRIEGSDVLYKWFHMGRDTSSS